MGVLEQALELAFRGLPVFPCGRKKTPVISSEKEGGKGHLDATANEDDVRALFKKAGGRAKLVGVPCGIQTGFDVLDIDPRNGGDRWEIENAHRLPETRVHITQSGGRHYLFRHAPGVRNSASKKTLAEGVDVRGEGGYVIYPPSYGYHIGSDAEISDWPDWLLEIVLKHLTEVTPRPSGPVSFVPISEKRLEAFVAALTRGVANASEGGKHFALRNAALSMGGIQQAAGLTDQEAVDRLLAALPRSVKDWRNAKATAEWGVSRGRDNPITLEDRPQYTNGHKTAPRPNTPLDEDAAEPAKIKWLPDEEWRDELATSDSGKVLRTLSNVMVAFRHCALWKGLFAWNQFSSRLIVTRPLPDQRPGLEVPRELSEADISNVTDWLQRNGIIVASMITREAIRAVAEDNSFHPVRDYLRSLKWDKTGRLDNWMITHLGVVDNDLHKAFGSRWMIGLVARVMDPGCQLDTALILESRQGLRKSTALRTLAEPWFTDHVPELGNKDALAQLQGVWIIELAELTSFSKAETHRIKSFLSTRVDRFRPSYGPVPVNHPRQCGFAGTINPGSNGYLRDETGSRRFWIAACGVGWESRRQIIVKRLATARDQLWAEAVFRYDRGDAWWLDDEELEKAQEKAAEKRQADDPREPKIKAFLGKKDWVRMDQVLGGECLNVPPERWTLNLRTELGFVMSTLGWTRKRKRGDFGLEWRYYAPNTQEEDDEEPETQKGGNSGNT